MWYTLLGAVAILVGMEDTKGDPVFALVGPNPMRLKESEVFSLAASYKYCSADSNLCSMCSRRVFVNVFDRSKCLGTVQASQMDCVTHKCKRRQFRAPLQAGTYEIRMYEVLGNGSCGMYRDTSGQGILIGTVIVGTPPQEPDILVTNIGFYSAAIQWTKYTKYVVYTVLIEDNKGNVKQLAEKTTKRRVMATKLTPGTNYNVSLKASNEAGDSGWIHFSFTTKQASLSLRLAPKNKTVVKGQPFTLRCFITGQPRPNTTWYKDGKLIGPRQNVRILHVPRASADDEGEYMCIGSNRMPGRNITAKANVIVFVPPMIEHLYSLLSHETISGRLGQTIALLCGLNKDNHVNYAWFKDGSALPNTSNHSNELTVSLNKRDDFGVYECEAYNKAGKTRKKIKVFADEEQLSTSSALSRSGKAAYYYYIVGILACVSLLLLVTIIALRQYYRRKLSVEYTDEGPYLTPRDELPRLSPQTARQIETEPQKVMEGCRETASTKLSTDYSRPRPLPPIPTERSKMDADDTPRYADLDSIEKQVYQELEREDLELAIKDVCPDMVNAFENAVNLETEEKSYMEVVP